MAYFPPVREVTCENWTANVDESDWECDFQGDVEVEIENDTIYWKCPSCGHENEMFLGGRD